MSDGRHDRAGLWSCSCFPTYPELEKWLKEKDIAFTRSKPTELTIQKIAYHDMMELKTMVHHCPILRKL